MRVTSGMSRWPFLLAISILLAGLSESARADRPGTPPKASLYNCPFSASEKPMVCGNFLNGASEAVKFEIDFKKNNVAASQKISCVGHTPEQGICWRFRRK